MQAADPLNHALRGCSRSVAAVAVRRVRGAATAVREGRRAAAWPPMPRPTASAPRSSSPPNATRNSAQRTGAKDATTRRILADFAIVKVDTACAAGRASAMSSTSTARALPDRDDRLVRAAHGSVGRPVRRSAASLRRKRALQHRPIQRNFNVPTTALVLLRLEQPRPVQVLGEGRRSAPVLWEIAFRETSRPTLIRTPAGIRCLRRQLWVNPPDGTVVRTSS